MVKLSPFDPLDPTDQLPPNQSSTNLDLQMPNTAQKSTFTPCEVCFMMHSLFYSFPT